MRFTKAEHDESWKLFFAIWPRCVDEKEGKYRFLEWIERKVTISKHLNKYVEYRTREFSLTCRLFGHDLVTVKISHMIHHSCLRCPYVHRISFPVQPPKEA